MVGDVGDPPLVRTLAGELAIDEVDCGGNSCTGLRRSCRYALEPGAAHEHLDGVVLDRDARAEGQLGVEPARAVDAQGLSVDLAEHVGQVRRAA